MWDTCLSKETFGGQSLYGIRNSKTGQVLDMAETMGVAQIYANAYNVRDGYREAPTSIYDITEADEVWLKEATK